MSVNSSSQHTSVVVNETADDSYMPPVASSYMDDENPFDSTDIDHGGAVMDGKSVFGNSNLNNGSAY